MRNKPLIILVLIGIGILVCSGCKKTISITSLLDEMADRKHLTYFPEEEYLLKQASSYNRASVAPGRASWFENNDMSHFIRVEETAGRREYVLLDTDGPGAIVRWWMTFYKAQNGIIRVYIDHDSIPSIKGAPSEVLSGSLLAAPPLATSVQAGAPLGEEGRDYDHNLYVPIPFNNHCKITYECDSIRILFDYEGTPVPKGYFWPDVFYNIGYRLYSGKVNLKSFTDQELKDSRSAMTSCGARLVEGTVESLSGKAFDEQVLPGDSVMIEIRGKDRAINHLSLLPEAIDLKQALRSTVVKISFDGNQTVWAPVGEFFGSGYSSKPHQTWMNRVNPDGLMESFWIMPFREKCTITLINYGKDSIHLKGSSGLTNYKWKANSMYFAASWHEYHHIRSRDTEGAPFDLNFIDINAKGVYVGDQVTLFNNSWKWWGEGDEKILVDGERFPSSFGTGSEDYYGYSFARQESFSHPFISQPEGTGNMGRGITINMRHRSLDAIPFHSSISSNIELWHWDTVCMNYALTTFYYVLPPVWINVEPDPESVKKAVAVEQRDLVCDDSISQSEYYTVADFEKVPKIDAHFHYLTQDQRYMKFAISLNFKLLTPIWDGEVDISDQLRISSAIRKSFPNDYAFFTTFSTDGIDDPGFGPMTIESIKKGIRMGATGVKVWKNIGMEVKNADGKYIVIDDPVFDPIFNYLEEKGIPVIGHLGEPRDCWLPEKEMTDPSDVTYYKNNPQYYMFRHPEVPSYEQQISARDNLLKKHPDLDFVAAHLASLEWNVDEIARRLDSFPNLKVDLAARMYHLQYQSKLDYDRVRDFMIKYQDRIEYGTDSEVHDIKGVDPDKFLKNLRRGWLAQWMYLATDSTLNVKGLKLPKQVIDKIYFKNAQRYFQPLKIQL